jgi:hypothetical protein
LTKEIHGERIKWKADQVHRVINGDEMSFGLDADSNNLGGRPVMYFIAEEIREAGEADQHSATKNDNICCCYIWR